MGSIKQINIKNRWHDDIINIKSFDSEKLKN